MKNTRKVLKTWVGLLALSGATGSFAASHFKVVFIDQYDRDGDGRVGSVEFETARRERFDLADENGDGTVNVDEYVLEYENRLDAQLKLDREEQLSQTTTRFRSLDDDEDERITWDEYAASGDYSWSRFDSNGDGMLDDGDEDSMADAVARRDAERSREQILHDRRRVLSMPSTHNMKGTIVQYDADGDERVSRSEFDAGRKANFERTDSDGNGWLSESEYRYEFEDRLDAEIASDRRGQVEQTVVRFGALDSDDDKIMTFEEYQNSGHRSFKRNDTDGDGFVTYEEADPVEPEFSREETEAETANKA